MSRGIDGYTGRIDPKSIRCHMSDSRRMMRTAPARINGMRWLAMQKGGLRWRTSLSQEDESSTTGSIESNAICRDRHGDRFQVNWKQIWTKFEIPLTLSQIPRSAGSLGDGTSAMGTDEILVPSGLS